MSVSQFPTPFDANFPSENYSAGVFGPKINSFDDLEVEFPGAVFKAMQDQGGNYGLTTPNALYRWRLLYRKKSDSTAANLISHLDDHWEESNGIFGEFNFRHPRTHVLYTGVHYESYSRGKDDKVWRQTRDIVLIKRPN